MRAEARGGVGPMSVPSEGRLRTSAQVQSFVHHTWKFCSKAHFLFPQGGSSISQNLSQSPAPKLGPMPPAHHVPRSAKNLFLGMIRTLSGGKIFKQQILSDPLPIHLAAQRVERVLERETHLHPVHGPTRPLAKVKMELASFLQPT